MREEKEILGGREFFFLDSKFHPWQTQGKAKQRGGKTSAAEKHQSMDSRGVTVKAAW
jgi:hypothetical protein